MDFEKRLYEALKVTGRQRTIAKPDLFRKPPTGKVRETESGPVWMVETVYDQGYLHGRVELSGDIPESALDFFDPSLDNDRFDFRSVAVIDTETTGLAGGTGTYPFIIGIGFWLDDSFVVRQYILRDFCEEPAQLRAISGDLKDTSCFLTYNGKSFDVPLLKTRFRINRLAREFPDRPHLDLLHACRRLYKRHFESFNLSLLEALVVGFERRDDVPSHLIPGIYFDFLQNRDESLLLPVLNHNRDDIVSLYVMAQETGRRIDLALSGACEDDLLMLSMGQLLFRQGDYSRASTLVDSIKPQFIDGGAADEALLFQAVLAKRLRDWEKAQSIWRSMIDSDRYGCYPHIELAKHLEHRERDFRSALDMTLAAVSLLEFERELMPRRSYSNYLKALKRRRKRLQDKLSREK
jgi:uncharacterized protein YprB with RNaseH-like and TPR domain